MLLYWEEIMETNIINYWCIYIFIYLVKDFYYFYLVSFLNKFVSMRFEDLYARDLCHWVSIHFSYIRLNMYVYVYLLRCCYLNSKIVYTFKLYCTLTVCICNDKQKSKFDNHCIHYCVNIILWKFVYTIDNLCFYKHNTIV